MTKLCATAGLESDRSTECKHDGKKRPSTTCIRCGSLIQLDKKMSVHVAEQGSNVDEASASAGSLWGDLGGLNLAGYDDWEDEFHVVDVEDVAAQLVSLVGPGSARGVLLLC